MFFGDVHVAHLYIFLCYVFLVMSKKIEQKNRKIHKMDNNKKHSTKINKDEQHENQQKT
jgi:hypothetical protein